MANGQNSPAFTAPTPSMEPDGQISTIGQNKDTNWGARASQLKADAKSEFPLGAHIPNGK